MDNNGSGNETGPVADTGEHSSTASVRQQVVQQLRTALNSELVQRKKFAGLAGLQFDGTAGAKRDVYKVAGYPAEYTFEHGWTRYKRQDIARRVVDLPVQKTWRHPPEIIDGEDPETGADTEFTRDWYELWTRLKMQAVAERADRMASIGEFSVILLGLAGAATDRDLKEPAEGLSGPGDVLYARPYKQSDVDIQKWVEDTDDPRFGLPLTYSIDIGGGEKGRAGRTQKSLHVHWTRVLHIVEDPLDSDVYGLPRLERILNRLMDLEKVCAATGEAFWQLAVQILQATVDPKASLSDDALEGLDDALEEIVHDLRRHFMGQGVDLEFLGGDTPDPSAPAELYMMLVAAASGIPKRVLFGTETGERASQQDERSWLGSIGERIEQYAEPTVVRQFTDRLILLGALKAPREDDYTLVWPPLYEATPQEKAETNKAKAETAKALTPIGGDPRELVEIDEDEELHLRPTKLVEIEVEEDKEIPDEGIEDEEGPEDPEDPEGDEMLDDAA